MKNGIMLLGIAVLLAPVSALARVDVNINVGVPAPVVPVPVVVAPAPPPPPPRVVVPPPPTVVFERPPLFLAPPRLGFYVGVDVPYDIVYVDDYYYLNYHNVWYRSGNYNGPWVGVRQERLPLMVRRQGVEYIRRHRDREFVNYRRDHDHYHGRPFWPGRDVREMRRDGHHDRRDWRGDHDGDWRRDRGDWRRDRDDWRHERR